MKKLFTLFVLTMGVVVFTKTSSYAQSSANATAAASATIVAPIAIAKNVDMNFGGIVPSATAGSVVLSAAASPSRTPTNVTLPTALTGTVTSAKFTVTGGSGSAYSVTLPGTASTLTATGGATMTVATFTSSNTGTLTGGSDILYVGGTLSVAANQAAGTYTTSTPFSVTVNYN